MEKLVQRVTRRGFEAEDARRNVFSFYTPSPNAHCMRGETFFAAARGRDLGFF